jgi:hypothetical protein
VYGFELKGSLNESSMYNLPFRRKKESNYHLMKLRNDNA